MDKDQLTPSGAPAQGTQGLKGEAPKSEIPGSAGSAQGALTPPAAGWESFWTFKDAGFKPNPTMLEPELQVILAQYEAALKSMREGFNLQTEALKMLAQVAMQTTRTALAAQRGERSEPTNPDSSLASGEASPQPLEGK